MKILGAVLVSFGVGLVFLNVIDAINDDEQPRSAAGSKKEFCGLEQVLVA